MKVTEVCNICMITKTSQLITGLINGWRRVELQLFAMAPWVDLLARCYIARIFLLSGYSKISDWQTTLYLFSEEYHVPVLPPDIAAVFGTAAELLLPVLLVTGIGTRLAASGLFMLNILAVAAYYHVLKDSPVALHDHLEWGIILGLLMVLPLQKITLDYWWQKTPKNNKKHH